MKRGTGRKLGFYELVAERLSIPEAEEDAMARGNRLEPEAIAMYEAKYNIKVKRPDEVWVSDENPNIMVSPDGSLDAKTAIEVKCLSSARHIQAYMEQEIPDEYMPQVMQYFIVNEKLVSVNVIFYDPRIPALLIHEIEVFREGNEETIEAYKAYQIEALEQINKFVEELTF